MTTPHASSRPLYNHLGVPPTADTAAIRRAYRKRAKSTHPDTPGGSAQAFAETSRALAILTDPARRARYDATGDISEVALDNSLAQLMELVMPLLDAVCVEAAQRGFDPLTRPLDEMMRAKASANLAGIRKKRSQGDAELKQAKKFLGRFKRRPRHGETTAPNLIEQGIAHRVAMIENSLRMIDEEIARHEKVVAFLESYGFAADAAPPQTTAGFAQIFVGR